RDGRMKSPEELQAVFAENGVDPDRPIVTTCGSGVTAAIIALALETMGRAARGLYDGSWSEWGADPARAVATG
ncbi:sulfurtransferase, partial [Staphylococcus aureus]|uniref:sulfurtransferase n=1 Tax=Staphylococcus aureus TaxID=1280 RepID=UPI0012710383